MGARLRQVWIIFTIIGGCPLDCSCNPGGYQAWALVIPLSWPWTILPAVVNQGWVLGLAMPLGGLLLWVSSHSGARLACCVVCIGVGLQCKILQFKKITIINSLEGGAYCN